MYKRKFWLDQEQPNLGYADVKLNIACMHPLACLHTLSLCVYNDLYGFYRSASIEKSCTSMSNKVAQRRIKISRARSRDCRSFSKRDLVREFNLISGMESQIQHKSVDSLPQSHRHHKPNGVRLGLQLPPNLVHIKGILVF